MKVLRLLVYEGDEEWIRSTMEHNAIPSEGKLEAGKGMIKSVTLGTIGPNTDLITRGGRNKPECNMYLDTTWLTSFIKELLGAPPIWIHHGWDFILKLNTSADAKKMQKDVFEWLERRIK